MFNTGTLCFTQPPDANSQPLDATFSIFQECQSCESESSSTRDLEKPILALPLHWIGPIPTLSFLLSDLHDKFLYSF